VAQQQLLLITLVVIILGLTIAVAVSMFGDSAVDANRDAVSGDLLGFAARAHEFHRRPSLFNGGGGSFLRLTSDVAGLARITNLPGGKSNNGVYSIHTAGTTDRVVLQGVGTEQTSDGHYVTVRVLVREGSADSLYQVY
jgi:hypothetical protein